MLYLVLTTPNEYKRDQECIVDVRISLNRNFFENCNDIVMTNLITLLCLLAVFQGPPGDIPNHITEARAIRGPPGLPVSSPFCACYRS